MTINLLVDDPRWRNSFKTLRVDVLKAVRMVLKDYDVKGAVVTLKFSTNEDVETLNHLYRGKKKPTNVLSFPNDEPPLGDIILAYETVKREAKEQKKTFRAHTLHLVVHATLHLLGYDHEKSREAEEMEALEIAYLKRLGIANPYESR
ncbi:MAG: rRNA maturation RNase YbeY [Alphaproteobacteria bacterium]|nr:rRNA maturation RNase YbeY [Alphaproteobacteria bacterium]